MATKIFTTFVRTHDTAIAVVFGIFSLAFIVTAIAVPPFMDWVFARHENILS